LKLTFCFPFLYLFIYVFVRFVSYFICPVFHEQAIQNEVEIIQCEHEKNKHSDVWRTNQVSLILIPKFVHSGICGAACTFISGICKLQGYTCCAACTNSNVWRTNLFLVRGLVHRGDFDAAYPHRDVGRANPSFYLSSEPFTRENVAEYG
jgi:hypothetical protein